MSKKKDLKKRFIKEAKAESKQSKVAPVKDKKHKKQVKGKRDRKSVKELAIDFFSPTTKKAKIISFSLVVIAGFALGAGTSNYKNNEVATATVATYDGGKVRAYDLYTQLKNNMNGSQLMLTTLEYEVFENAYGDKITDKQVDDFYRYYVSSGITTQIVGNNGVSEKDAKALIKKNLAFEYGVKKQLKVSDEEKEKTFKSNWQPDQEIQFLSFDSKEEADKALAEVNSGVSLEKVSNYDKIVGSQTETVTYSQSVGILPDTLYNLKTGEAGELISTQADSSGSPVNYYYVVKMVKATHKGNDWEKFDKELSEIVKQTKIAKNDKAVTEIIKQEFARAGVKINDKYMQKALADYVEE